MSRLDKFDPHQIAERLRVARSAAGLTQDKVASELGMARTTLVAIERGNRKLGSQEFLDLCRLYRCSANELLRPNDIRVDLAARFRTSKYPYENETTSAAVRLLNKLASSSIELETLLQKPVQPNYPREQPIGPGDIQQQAEDAALALRHQLGLGLTPIEDIVSLLELEVGIRVFIRPIDSTISGLYAYDANVGAHILLNSKHPRERRAMTAAHETGHFVGARHVPDINEGNQEDIGCREERFATSFALSFLMPAAAIRRRFSEVSSEADRFSPRHLILLAHMFHVSTEAMSRRLEALSLLPKGTYESLRDRGLSAGTVRQVLGDPSPEPSLILVPRLSMLSAEAYRRGLVSEGQLCEKLQMDRLEVRLLLDALGIQDSDESETFST
jgi:Zn-dependent peptidase ImmA (M78 family)/DNA-binding XRE family transcriptional regulator